MHEHLSQSSDRTQDRVQPAQFVAPGESLIVWRAEPVDGQIPPDLSEPEVAMGVKAHSMLEEAARRAEHRSGGEAQPRLHVIADLRGVRYLPQPTLSRIIACSVLARKGGGRFTLFLDRAEDGGEPAIVMLFRIARLDRGMEIRWG
jgi:hypothetical protein